jgi:hypothetical protein
MVKTYLKKITFIMLAASLICLFTGKGRDDVRAEDKASLKGLVDAGSTYVGTESCTACHDAEHKEFELSTHSRISVKEEEPFQPNGCEMPAGD